MGEFITFPELLLWLPLIGGVFVFSIKTKNAAWHISFLFSLALLVVSVITFFFTGHEYVEWNAVDYYYPNNIGNTFYLGLDGLGRLLILLTSLVYLLALLMLYEKRTVISSTLTGLLMLSQFALIGTILSLDALLYFSFWSVAIVIMFFLIGRNGDEKSSGTGLKFYLYLFSGSLLLLTGIVCVYLHTSPHIFENGTQSIHSFSYNAFTNAGLQVGDQHWIIWLFLLAFAIQIPIFPFHNWFVEVYEHTSSPIKTIVGGVMCAVGLLGIVRWTIPVFPEAISSYAQYLVIYMIGSSGYFALLMFSQKSVYRMLAYCSMSFLGIICTSVFVLNKSGMEGALFQTVCYGFDIALLLFLFWWIEEKWGIKEINSISGLRSRSGVVSFFLAMGILSCLALPITNSFWGVQLIFKGLIERSLWLGISASFVGILLISYLLSIVKRIFSKGKSGTEFLEEKIHFTTKLGLVMIAILIFGIGLFPQPILHAIRDAVDFLTIKTGLNP